MLLYDMPFRVQSRVGPDGTIGQQRLYKFPNGHGASVIPEAFAPGFYELAPLRWISCDTFEIALANIVTNGDVRRRLTMQDIEVLLQQLASLVVVNLKGFEIVTLPMAAPAPNPESLTVTVTWDEKSC